MKKEFFDYIIELMRKNKKIYFISIGLGWPRINELKKSFPTRFIQTEAAEQTALDIAVGLSLSGKTVFTYTITPFYWRAAETIRLYISHENIPVIMCGAGRGDDYSKDDGFSHDANDIVALMDALVIPIFHPDTKKEMRQYMRDFIKKPKPAFLSLTR